jgi:hypothetical protein
VSVFGVGLGFDKSISVSLIFTVILWCACVCNIVSGAEIATHCNYGLCNDGLVECIIHVNNWEETSYLEPYNEED